MGFFMDMLSLTVLENVNLSIKYNSDIPIKVQFDLLRLHSILVRLIYFVQKEY